MSSPDESKFSKLLSAVTEVSQMYEDAVYIGGIAVYMHAINKKETSHYAGTTSDADFYITFTTLSELRHMEEVHQNTRLKKHEFLKDGFSFDVYTERQSSLPIDYDFVKAHAVSYGDVKVAALEELLVLKLEAAVDRYSSVHGKKDAKDVIRILLLASMEEAFSAKRATDFMNKEHFECLERIMKGPEFMALAEGNSQIAKRLKIDCGKTFETVKEEFNKPPAASHAKNVKASESDLAYAKEPGILQTLRGDSKKKKTASKPGKD